MAMLPRLDGVRPAPWFAGHRNGGALARSPGYPLALRPLQGLQFDSGGRFGDECAVPRVFVLVTFWNGAKLLGRCLRSLERQDCPATIVLVDDASEHSAHEVAREWCQGSAQRVLLTKAQNEGPAAARALGLEWIKAQSNDDSDVIVLVDGDDELVGERALSTIVDVYRRLPGVQLTLGGHRRASGQPIYESRYRESHFRRRLLTVVSWRARHPRSFRLGLLRRAWPHLRLRWPNGEWIRSATDQALLMPMLERIDWEQLHQLEEVLYLYNDVRPDGATMERSLRGRLRQLVGEAYVRRSVRWSAAALPLLAMTTAKRQIKKLKESK